MRTFGRTILAVVLVACLRPAAASGQQTVTDIVLLVDVSASMNVNLPLAGDDKFAVLKDRLQKFVLEELPTNARVALISVGRDPKVIVKSSEKRFKLFKAISNLKTEPAPRDGRGTNITAALDLALKELIALKASAGAKENQRLLFLITDGEHNVIDAPSFADVLNRFAGPKARLSPGDDFFLWYAHVGVRDDRIAKFAIALKDPTGQPAAFSKQLEKAWQLRAFYFEPSNIAMRAKAPGDALLSATAHIRGTAGTTVRFGDPQFDKLPADASVRLTNSKQFKTTSNRRQVELKFSARNLPPGDYVGRLPLEAVERFALASPRFVAVKIHVPGARIVNATDKLDLGLMTARRSATGAVTLIPNPAAAQLAVKIQPRIVLAPDSSFPKDLHLSATTAAGSPTVKKSALAVESNDGKQVVFEPFQVREKTTLRIVAALKPEGAAVPARFAGQLMLDPQTPGVQVESNRVPFVVELKPVEIRLSDAVVDAVLKRNREFEATLAVQKGQLQPGETLDIVLSNPTRAGVEQPLAEMTTEAVRLTARTPQVTVRGTLSSDIVGDEILRIPLKASNPLYQLTSSTLNVRVKATRDVVAWEIANVKRMLQIEPGKPIPKLVLKFRPDALPEGRDVVVDLKVAARDPDSPPLKLTPQQVTLRKAAQQTFEFRVEMANLLPGQRDFLITPQAARVRFKKESDTVTASIPKWEVAWEIVNDRRTLEFEPGKPIPRLSLKFKPGALPEGRDVVVDLKVAPRDSGSPPLKLTPQRVTLRKAAEQIVEFQVETADPAPGDRQFLITPQAAEVRFKKESDTLTTSVPRVKVPWEIVNEKRTVRIERRKETPRLVLNFKPGAVPAGREIVVDLKVEPRDPNSPVLKVSPETVKLRNATEQRVEVQVQIAELIPGNRDYAITPQAATAEFLKPSDTVTVAVPTIAGLTPQATSKPSTSITDRTRCWPLEYSVAVSDSLGERADEFRFYFTLPGQKRQEGRVNVAADGKSLRLTAKRFSPPLSLVQSDGTRGEFDTVAFELIVPADLAKADEEGTRKIPWNTRVTVRPPYIRELILRDGDDRELKRHNDRYRCRASGEVFVRIEENDGQLLVSHWGKPEKRVLIIRDLPPDRTGGPPKATELEKWLRLAEAGEGPVVEEVYAGQALKLAAGGKRIGVVAVYTYDKTVNGEPFREFSELYVIEFHQTSAIVWIGFVVLAAIALTLLYLGIAGYCRKGLVLSEWEIKVTPLPGCTAPPGESTNVTLHPARRIWRAFRCGNFGRFAVAPAISGEKQLEGVRTVIVRLRKDGTLTARVLGDSSQAEQRVLESREIGGGEVSADFTLQLPGIKSATGVRIRWKPPQPTVAASRGPRETRQQSSSRTAPSGAT